MKEAVNNGEIINEYPDDKPLPSILALYIKKGNPLHVVYSIDRSLAEHRYIIITVYEPTLDEWNENFKTRRYI